MANGFVRFILMLVFINYATHTQIRVGCARITHARQQQPFSRGSPLRSFPFAQHECFVLCVRSARSDAITNINDFMIFRSLVVICNASGDACWTSLISSSIQFMQYTIYTHNC